MTTLLTFPDDSYQTVLDAVDAELNAIDAREAEDEFACLEQHNCINPGGHLFLGSSFVEVCRHCRRVTWRR